MSEKDDIERDGFFKMTIVALSANMAAAKIHGGMRVDWKNIVHHAGEGANELWEAVLLDREIALNCKMANVSPILKSEEDANKSAV
jgi:hypothetical protein